MNVPSLFYDSTPLAKFVCSEAYQQTYFNHDNQYSVSMLAFANKPKHS